MVNNSVIFCLNFQNKEITINNVDYFSSFFFNNGLKYIKNFSSIHFFNFFFSFSVNYLAIDKNSKNYESDKLTAHLGLFQ